MAKARDVSCLKSNARRRLAGVAIAVLAIAAASDARAQFAPVIDLSSLNGSTGFRLDGAAAGDYSGISVASAGDVNGDGFADLIVGAPGADPNGQSGAGSSYVLFGAAGGFGAAVNLSTLNGTTGFRLDGPAAGDLSGISAASAGDVNGDGFADLIIGAWGSDPGGRRYAGSSYVVFGRAPDTSVARAGAAASQYISGGPFADFLSGAGGNDVLEGRGGRDVLDGGTGANTASYKHAPDPVTVNLTAPEGNSGHAARDVYFFIQNLEGSNFADQLTGNGIGNRLAAGKGNDTIRGLGGNDRLEGGAGLDLQTGGSGNDSFVLLTASDSPAGNGRDQITDFNPGTPSTAIDRIDVSKIDAQAGVAGNQAFSFIGTNAFTGAKGQLRVRTSDGGLIVQGDVDGNRAADFELLLKNFYNTAAVTAGDFEL